MLSYKQRRVIMAKIRNNADRLLIGIPKEVALLLGLKGGENVIITADKDHDCINIQLIRNIDLRGNK